MSLSQPFDSQMPSGFDVNSNRGPYLIRVTTACIILSLVAVFLRFLSRMLARLDFKADDWVTLLALVYFHRSKMSTANGSTIAICVDSWLSDDLWYAH